MGRVQDLTALADSKPFIKRSPQFFSAIRFQETVFALPFAYTGMILAADGLPTFYQFMWITVAMVNARTFGMAFNRVADRHIDARNLRRNLKPPRDDLPTVSPDGHPSDRSTVRTIRRRGP